MIYPPNNRARDSAAQTPAEISRHLPTFAPAFSLRGGRKSPVDHDDLAIDQAIARDQVDDYLGYILRGYTAAQRSALSPARHQIVITVRQYSFHPIPFHPPGRHGIDANFGTQVEG